MNKTTRKHWAKCTTGGGFTLAELLIVVAVIAVLVAVAIPTFTNQLEKSRQAVDVSNLRGAYAQARLAEIDQAVNSRTFKSIAESTTEGAVTDLKFWYSPDSGNLTHITDDDETAKSIDGTAGQFGRATKETVVADVSQLPNVCKYYYNGTNLAAIDFGTSGDEGYIQGKVGTLDKCILVEFEASGNGYKIKSISFVPFASQDPVSSLTVKDYSRVDSLGEITITATDEPSSKLTGVKFVANLADGTSINATVEFKSGASDSAVPTDETWGSATYTAVSTTTLTEGVKVYYRVSVEGSTVYDYGTISTITASGG